MLPAMTNTLLDRPAQPVPPPAGVGQPGRILVTGLTKHYRGVTAVDDLSFAVETGRVTGFLGPNGAGKTTTLRMLLGLVASDSGTATISGLRYVDLAEPSRVVGAVLEASSAHRDRTVKLRKYAEAGIPHYWCVEDEEGAPVVHVYELDGPTGVYAPAGIFRGTLERPVPFEISLDLGDLLPRRRA